MIRIRRTILTLTAIVVLLPISARAAQSRSEGSAEAGGETHTISGSVPASGVKMTGLPGEPVTDQNGFYSVEVSEGWTGTVTPTKAGYVFEPAHRAYSRVAADCESQDYTYVRMPFTISGIIGLPGVTMQGLPGDPVTDSDGRYSAKVEYGWSGDVRPVREGYEFRPIGRGYNRVSKDCRDDYTPEAIRILISGNAGIPGVIMRGLPSHTVTGESGRYLTRVSYGWSGTVEPKKDGYKFDPPQRVYEPLTRDRTSDDYLANPQTVVISDVVRTDPEGPVAGVTVTAEPGGYTSTTDSAGRFTVEVPYGWTGHLRLSQGGRTLPQASGFAYNDVTGHIIDGERIPAWEEPVIPAPRFSAMRPRTVLPGGVGEVLVIPTTEVAPERFAEVTEDMGVMLHILRDKLSEPRMIMGVWNDYGDFFSGGGREAFYLQGYGALFVMEVDFPLSFAAPQTDPTEAQEQTVDPVWQRARQRLYAPTGRRRGSDPLGRSPETDRGSFEQFKDDLLRTLKHAANIRHLDPNEKVILTIIGQMQGGLPGSGFSGGGSFSDGGGGWGFEGGSWTYSGGSFGYEGGRTYGDSGAYSRGSGRSAYGARRGPLGPPAASTVLTFQATKADVDAFAAGTLDFEQFRQRVKTFTY